MEDLTRNGSSNAARSSYYHQNAAVPEHYLAAYGRTFEHSRFPCSSLSTSVKPAVMPPPSGVTPYVRNDGEMEPYRYSGPEYVCSSYRFPPVSSVTYTRPDFASNVGLSFKSSGPSASSAHALPYSGCSSTEIAYNHSPSSAAGSYPFSGTDQSHSTSVPTQGHSYTAAAHAHRPFGSTPYHSFQTKARCSKVADNIGPADDGSGSAGLYGLTRAEYYQQQYKSHSYDYVSRSYPSNPPDSLKVDNYSNTGYQPRAGANIHGGDPHGSSNCGYAPISTSSAETFSKTSAVNTVSQSSRANQQHCDSQRTPYQYPFGVQPSFKHVHEQSSRNKDVLANRRSDVKYYPARGSEQLLSAPKPEHSYEITKSFEENMTTIKRVENPFAAVNQQTPRLEFDSGVDSVKSRYCGETSEDRRDHRDIMKPPLEILDVKNKDESALDLSVKTMRKTPDSTEPDIDSGVALNLVTKVYQNPSNHVSSSNLNIKYSNNGSSESQIDARIHSSSWPDSFSVSNPHSAKEITNKSVKRQVEKQGYSTRHKFARVGSISDIRNESIRDSTSYSSARVPHSHSGIKTGMATVDFSNSMVGVVGDPVPANRLPEFIKCESGYHSITGELSITRATASSSVSPEKSGKESKKSASKNLPYRGFVTEHMTVEAPTSLMADERIIVRLPHNPPTILETAHSTNVPHLASRSPSAFLRMQNPHSFQSSTPFDGSFSNSPPSVKLTSLNKELPCSKLFSQKSATSRVTPDANTLCVVSTSAAAQQSSLNKGFSVLPISHRQKASPSLISPQRQSPQINFSSPSSKANLPGLSNLWGHMTPSPVSCSSPHSLSVSQKISCSPQMNFDLSRKTPHEVSKNFSITSSQHTPTSQPMLPPYLTPPPSRFPTPCTSAVDNFSHVYIKKESHEINDFPKLHYSAEKTLVENKTDIPANTSVICKDEPADLASPGINANKVSNADKFCSLSLTSTNTESFKAQRADGKKEFGNSEQSVSYLEKTSKGTESPQYGDSYKQLEHIHRSSPCSSSTVSTAEHTNKSFSLPHSSSQSPHSTSRNICSSNSPHPHSTSRSPCQPLCKTKSPRSSFSPIHVHPHTFPTANMYPYFDGHSVGVDESPGSSSSKSSSFPLLSTYATKVTETHAIDSSHLTFKNSSIFSAQMNCPVLSQTCSNEKDSMSMRNYSETIAKFESKSADLYSNRVSLSKSPCKDLNLISASSLIKSEDINIARTRPDGSTFEQLSFESQLNKPYSHPSYKYFPEHSQLSSKTRSLAHSNAYNSRQMHPDAIHKGSSFHSYPHLHSRSSDPSVRQISNEHITSVRQASFNTTSSHSHIPTPDQAPYSTFIMPQNTQTTWLSPHRSQPSDFSAQCSLSFQKDLLSPSSRMESKAFPKHGFPAYSSNKQQSLESNSSFSSKHLNAVSPSAHFIGPHSTVPSRQSNILSSYSVQVPEYYAQKPTNSLQSKSDGRSDSITNNSSIHKFGPNEYSSKVDSSVRLPASGFSESRDPNNTALNKQQFRSVPHSYPYLPVSCSPLGSNYPFNSIQNNTSLTSGQQHSSPVQCTSRSQYQLYNRNQSDNFPQLKNNFAFSEITHKEVSHPVVEKISKKDDTSSQRSLQPSIYDGAVKMTEKTKSLGGLDVRSCSKSDTPLFAKNEFDQEDFDLQRIRTKAEQKVYDPAKGIRNINFNKIVSASSSLDDLQLSKEHDKNQIPPERQMAAKEHKLESDEYMEWNWSIDKFVTDLRNNKEVSVSRKARTVNRRYQQKLALQRAIENNESEHQISHFSEPDTESEPEPPVKFRGKFKSIKDKSTERLILTYASHSDESCTELIPDEDASDYEMLLKESIAMKKKSTHRKSKVKKPQISSSEDEASSMTDQKKSLKNSCGNRIKKAKAGAALRRRKKSDDTDFTPDSSDESSDESSESDSSNCSNSTSSAELRSRPYKRRRLAASDSSDQDVSSGRLVRQRETSLKAFSQSSSWTDDEDSAKRLPKKSGRRGTKNKDGSSDDSAYKPPRSTKVQKLRRRKIVSTKQKESVGDSAKNNLAKVKGKLRLVASVCETRRNRKKCSLSSDNRSESDDSKISKKRYSSRVIKSESDSDFDDKLHGDNEAKLQKIELKPKSVIQNNSNSNFVSDSILIKLRMQQLEEQEREDVKLDRERRKNLTKLIVEKLDSIQEAKFRHNWTKPNFGDENAFHPGWQEGLLKFKKEIAKLPKKLLYSKSLSSLNVDELLKSPGVERRSSRPKGNERRLQCNATTCRVSSIEQLNDSDDCAHNTKGFNLDSFPAFGTMPISTGLTPTPSVAPSMLASNDSDSDSLASRRSPASDSAPLIRRKSVATQLIKKLKRKYNPVSASWLTKPRALIKTENVPKLLPTPGLATESQVNLRNISTFFRKDTVEAHSSLFDELVKKNGVNVFCTTLLKFRTRNENKQLLDEATMKAVFGELPPKIDTPLIARKASVKQHSSAAKKKSTLHDSNFVPTASCSSTPLETRESSTVATPGEDSETLLNSPSSIADENNITTQTLLNAASKLQPLASKRHRRKYKLNKSSGFDYLRKKKKPVVRNLEDESGFSSNRKKAHLLRRQVLWPEETKDIAGEVRNWVVSKHLGETILHKAARLNCHDVIIYCVESPEYEVDARDNAGYTPLHEACHKGHLAAAQALLAHGATVNASGHGGVRPLHEATENGHVELTRLLLSYGADPTLCTYSGQRPADLARSHDACTMLLHHHLLDITGLNGPCWEFAGPVAFMDDTCQGVNVFRNMPKYSPIVCEAAADTVSTLTCVKQESDVGELASDINSNCLREFVFEDSEDLLPQVFMHRTSRQRFMLLTDVLKFKKLNNLQDLVIEATSVIKNCSIQTRTEKLGNFFAAYEGLNIAATLLGSGGCRENCCAHKTLLAASYSKQESVKFKAGTLLGVSNRCRHSAVHRHAHVQLVAYSDSLRQLMKVSETRIR